jgi:hypothetical protein
MRFAAIAVTALTVSMSAFAVDPFVGTWKPNVEKWKLSPGAPEQRKSQMITIETKGKNQYHITTKTADGKANPGVWMVDGEEHQLADGDTRKIERINERHLRMTVSGPKGSTVNDWIVSPDGKTLTNTRKGTGTTSGRPLDELLVYDKQ